MRHRTSITRGPTVADYAWKWIARRAPNLKPSTRKSYGDIIRVICEGLGHFKMADLTPGDVSHWLTNLPPTNGGWRCAGILRVLRTMTRDAKADLRLTHGACERVSPPRTLIRYSDEDPNALTADQLARLFVAMREHEPAWFPLFATMALTGMRFAEASALQWSDIDANAQKISVARNQYRGMLSTPKTVGSRRSIPLVAELAEILEDHKRALADAPVVMRTSSWVFPSTIGGLHPSGALGGPMSRAAEIAQIGFRITPHGLRRTLNTIALQIAPAETIRAILGHVTTDMTVRYNAPTLDARRDVLTRVVKRIDMRAR